MNITLSKALPSMHCRQHQGFTLLELIVVLVLLGIAAVLVAPQIGGSLQSAKLKTETRNVLAVFRSKRSEAIGSGQIITFAFDEQGEYYSVNDERIALDEGIYLFLEGQDDNNLPGIPGLAVAENSIDFYPDGSASGGILRLSSADKSHFISVDWLTGEVSMANNIDQQAYAPH